MTSARDQQIRAIHQAALERPAAERAAFVALLTGGDHELRQSVEGLLAEENATDVGARGDLDAVDAPEVAAGTRLGHYRIDGVLGRGGMGTVYRATDTKLQRCVAIKFLSIAEADAEAKRRFRQEAQTASGLNHPHIVTVYDVGELDGRQYIVSELVDGGTLDDWSAASRRRGWRQSIELLTGIADAIAAAHTAGVLHRDVKPGNVLIGSNGYAKLADFGLAKLLHTGAGSAEPTAKGSKDTRAGVVVGTIAYMSPEQASGLPLDVRSDIFSFGIVLYELLAGRRPFEAANDLELLKTIVHAPPPPLPSDVPELLRNAVERALEKDAADRYQSMRELVIELKRIGRKSASAAQPALPVDSSSRRSASLWLVAVLSTAVLVAVFAAMSHYRRVADMPTPAGPSARARDYEITRLTTSGNAVAPALSSDGKYVAYGQQGAAGTSLWIRQVASASDVRIVDSQPGSGVFVPIVRPDSSFVDFLRDARPAAPAPQLWRVPFLGGIPRRLVENVWSPIGWSADGRQMAFVRVDAAADSSSIVLADADGQRERVLATYPNYERALLSVFWNPDPLGAPAWSPDGRLLAVFATRPSSERPQVLFLDVATGAEVAALDSVGGFVPQGLVWLDAESLLLNQPAETGAPVQLWRMTYPGGAVSRLTNDLSSYVGVSLDADRASFVTAQSETRGSLWVGDAAGSAGSEILPLTPTVQSSVAWAGDRLLYGSLTNGRPGTASLPAVGGVSMEVARSAVAAVATSDGARIVYAKETGGADVGIWVADADGRQARQLVAELVGNPIVTPDDQQVIFLSYQNAIQSPWIVPLGGGEPRQIVDAWAASPTLNVSPDGRRLLFLGSDSQNRFRFVVCELPSCANRRDFALPANFRSPFTRWTPDGEGIAYLESSAMNIWSLPLGGGAPQQITHFTDRAIESFAWSRDGTRLAVLRTTTTSDIVLLKGLKK